MWIRTNVGEDLQSEYRVKERVEAGWKNRYDILKDVGRRHIPVYMIVCATGHILNQGFCVLFS